MNPNDSSIEMLFERVEKYGITTVELLKLSFIDKFADVISSIALKIAIYFSVVMFVLIINIGIALWLGDLLGKSYLGFFAMALFYALITFIVSIYGRNMIKIPISNRLIIKLLESHSYENGEPK
jgi:hypothetical protein